LASICFSIQPFATFRRVSPGPPDKVVSLAAPRSHSFFARWSPKVVRNVTRSRRHYFSFAFSPISAYLRLAEKSVEQLIWQLSGCLRSDTSHTVKPTKTITVTTSLASALSFTIPRPQNAFTINNIAVHDRRPIKAPGQSCVLRIAISSYIRLRPRCRIPTTHCASIAAAPPDCGLPI
jgi:hypothetical protein